jgi:DNA-binding transcriptional MerR regulator
MSTYSIKEVETLSGIKAHTLRIWEQRYHFLRPERTDTNIRHYTDAQLKLILNVATLNRSGMKISRIAAMDERELASKVLQSYDLTTAPDSLTDSLIHAMLDFDENRFEKALSSAIVKLGFEDTFTKLVIPFLIRTGALWSTGAVRVVQEHFISNLIRRKVCAAIDSLYVPENPDKKKFILFLPEGETHELVLLYMEYLLRKKGHDVAYLGSSLPFEELPFITEIFHPEYLITYQTVALEQMPFQEYLDRLSSMFPQCRIIVGGNLLVSLHYKLPVNCIAVYSTEDFIAAIGK